MKKLFCIPGAGASAVMFLPWMKELNGSEDFKLCLLEIPGRGMRKKDTPAKTMEELVDVLIQKIDIQLKPDESYVIYGYCFGAIIGYELCRKLRMLGKKEPEHFFCSSIREIERLRNPCLRTVRSEEKFDRCLSDIFRNSCLPTQRA